MSIRLYKGISKQELNASRKTSEGKTYTLNHPKELVIDMRYKGRFDPNANSQGWERSSSYYFKELQEQHPELFSKKNNMLIKSGRSPVVDVKFTDAFPEYKGETLVHHHIGQDGQAVALPQSIHKGYGEIHTVEHDVGITTKAQAFSDNCEKACKRDSSLYGQTSGQFSEKQKKNEETRHAGNIPSHTQNSIQRATYNIHNTRHNSLTKKHREKLFIKRDK